MEGTRRSAALVSILDGVTFHKWSTGTADGVPITGIVVAVVPEVHLAVRGILLANYTAVIEDARSVDGGAGG